MKKKRLAALLIASLVLLVVMYPVAAQDDDATATPESTPTAIPTIMASTEFYVTPLYRVNVRSGPGTSYTIFGMISPDDTVDITGQNEDGTWLRLNYNGQEGWVFGELMDVSGDLTNALIVEAGETAMLGSDMMATPMAEETPEMSEGDEDDELGISTSYNTNLRASYSRDAEILATIPFDTVLDALGRSDDNNWIMVLYEDQEGWVYAPILFFASGDVIMLPVTATIPMTMTPEATDEPESADTAS